MGTLGGIALIVAIVLIAGVIAYIGDRVGHQVGRKRLTLFNLRPKYTSTIVAVGTGMMIALVVTLTALGFPLRQAGVLPPRRDQQPGQRTPGRSRLAQQARAREQRGHQSRRPALRSVPVDHAVSSRPPRRLKNLSAFFDAVVQSLDRRYAPRSSSRIRCKSDDPEVRKKLAGSAARPARGRLPLTGSDDRAGDRGPESLCERSDPFRVRTVPGPADLPRPPE